jgi:hypothetical protein
MWIILLMRCCAFLRFLIFNVFRISPVWLAISADINSYLHWIWLVFKLPHLQQVADVHRPLTTSFYKYTPTADKPIELQWHNITLMTNPLMLFSYDKSRQRKYIIGPSKVVKQLVKCILFFRQFISTGYKLVREDDRPSIQCKSHKINHTSAQNK